MLKNLLNIILSLFGSKKETAQSDWSAGDYDKYAERKRESREEVLASKEKKDDNTNA